MRDEVLGQRSEVKGWCFWALAIFACVFLSAAAVWMGGINQDEGWYLYAANLASEGQMPYRDFFYTQGPMLPKVYSSFTWIWAKWGLLGARVFTLLLGLVGVSVAALTARMLVSEEKKNAVALIVTLLLGCNLYHLYYLAIPKTYALASLFVTLGFGVLVRAFAEVSLRNRVIFAAMSGFFLAYAAGTRISLGAILCVVGCWFLFRREWKNLVWFCVGGFLGLGLVYGPFLLNEGARAGLIAAQQYHSARGGFDPVFTVGSFSRLVRWYLPLFIVLGLGIAGLVANKSKKGDHHCPPPPLLSTLTLISFLAVFAVQMLAPFPYEDYQVPIMGLLAVYAAVLFVSIQYPTIQQSNNPTNQQFSLLLVLGLAFATAFGSPLLEKWTTNGQDRFWSLKKEKFELAQLRDVAKMIEKMDPGGKTIFTQDTYLAIETGRKVPKGLEMGPFSMLDDAGWRRLIATADCPVAAISGYTFAVEPPKCNERSVSQQVEYFSLLKKNYSLSERVEAFGQNSTTLMLLKRK